MSIINKVLKDLNKRQQVHHLDNVPQSQITAVASNKFPWLWLIIALLSMGLGAFAMQQWQQYQQLPIKAQVQQQTQPQAQPETLSQTQPQAEQQTQTKILPKANALTVTNTPILQTNIEKVAKADEVAKQVTVSKITPPLANHDTQLRTTAHKSHAKTQAEMQSARVTKPEVQEPLTTVAKTATKPIVKSASNSQQQSAHPQGNMAITEVKLTPKQIAENKIKRAMRLEDQGALDDAIDLYSQALKYNSDQHFARRQLAALFYGQGRLSAAIDTLEQGIALYPQQYEYSLLLSKVEQAAGNDNAALESLDLISDSSPLARQKWIHQGNIAQRIKSFSKAEFAYRHLVQIEPSQGNWWMALAYNVDAQGRYQEAARIYQKALTTPGLSEQSMQYVNNRLAQLGMTQ